jgi:flagellar biosynthetic protein FliQ
MTPDYSLEILQRLMVEIITLASPLLLTAMFVGLVISLLQAVTSIQEQTLTFVPKALAVVGVLFLILPWLLRSIMDFTVGIFERIPLMVR